MGLEGDEKSNPQIPKKSLFRYNSPLVQVSLIGVVCFCCPGMFNALSGMGGGGQVDTTVADNASTALYTTFAIFGIVGGGVYNILGPRLTLFAGCSTYVLYAGSFLYYNHYKDQTFAIIAGAILGIGAGFLWAGEGAIMTSYPPPDRKGTYISIFWSIFNMGGVIGGLIPFATNYHRTASSVNDATYIGFMCFMFLGAVTSLAILPAHRVVRDDGSQCTNIKYSNMSTESVAILKLFLDWKMLLMVPAAWSSNFFYTYQFNNVNAALFNLRTRGFNNVFYWGAQMVGSVAIGYLLDFSFASRRKRGLFGIGVVAVLGTGIWAGGLANQLRYGRDRPLPVLLDFKDSGSGFGGPFFLYFCFGLLDAMFQTMVYWVIGALADDSQTLSRYSGFYKGVQSAGAAVAWQVDNKKVSFMTQLVVNWSLTSLSYPLLLALVFFAVNDQTEPIVDQPPPPLKDYTIDPPSPPNN